MSINFAQAEQILRPKLDHYIGGSVQDCNISSALAMEILQSCTKPSIYTWKLRHGHI